jgi:hypothetical protein
MNTVSYEWDVETVQEVESAEYAAGDILEHDHSETYAKAAHTIKTFTPDNGTSYQIVLVRDDDNGRSWAYMEGGILPEYFEDAYGAEVAKVPKRFHAEVAAELGIDLNQ